MSVEGIYSEPGKVTSVTKKDRYTLNQLLPNLSRGERITHPLLDNDPVMMDSGGQLHRHYKVGGQWVGATELKMNYFLLVSDEWKVWG